MLIRYGYELAFNCAQPTLMVCLLDSNPEYDYRIRYKSPFLTSPSIGTQTYADSFGNKVRRFVAPVGDLTISRDFVIEDAGLPDGFEQHAQETPLEYLPSETLVYLLGSRYCETDKLGDIAWRLFGSTPRGWSRVKAICDFVCGHLTFGYEYARATRTAFEAYHEGVGVCRDFAHLAVALCRCMNIPARYANGFLGDIGVPPDPAQWTIMRGSKPGSTGAGSPLTPATTRHGSGASLSRADATPPTFRSRPHLAPTSSKASASGPTRSINRSCATSSGAAPEPRSP